MHYLEIELFGNIFQRYLEITLFENIFQHYLEIDIIWKSSTSLFRKILFGTRARSAPQEKIKLFGKNIIWIFF